MERLLNLLKEIKRDVDFENAVELVDNGILDSLDIVNIISAIEETYGVEVNPDEIDPDNFQCVNAMCEMIRNILN